MKKLFYWVFAATLLCGEGMLTSCTNDSTDNPVVTPRERVIKFEGIDNARDMGGLVMQDGRTVRFDMLIRSGKLFKATDADVAILQNQYHLSDVFDFRFDMELKEAPDRIIDGVTYTQVSTMPEAIIKAQAEMGAGSGQLSTPGMVETLLKYAFDPTVQEMAKQLYPLIVTDPQSQANYGKFLRGVRSCVACWPLRAARYGTARRARTAADGDRLCSWLPSEPAGRSSSRTSTSLTRAMPPTWRLSLHWCAARMAAKVPWLSYRLWWA